MSKVVRHLVAATGFAVLSLPTFGAAADQGSGGNASVYDRTIVIRPQTKTINVVQDETIKVVSEKTGQSFVWKFNTGGFEDVKLNSVAPPGVLDQEVTAYVCDRNPT